MSAQGKLNGRQRAFAEHYVANGGNGLQAAISAGYSDKGAEVTASKLLRVPKVGAYVRELQAELREDAIVDAQWVLNELVDNLRNLQKCDLEKTGGHINRCLELIGKSIGMFDDRIKLSIEAEEQLSDLVAALPHTLEILQKSGDVPDLKVVAA